MDCTKSTRGISNKIEALPGHDLIKFFWVNVNETVTILKSVPKSLEFFQFHSYPLERRNGFAFLSFKLVSLLQRREHRSRSLLEPH